jgi:CHAD domain-containing protein
MAFRLKLDDPIEKNFHRIGLEQIQRARKQLDANVAPETEIHEARKCIKRVRALLRLAREGLGDRIFRAENARFRAIAAQLAPARDDHVILQTILLLETQAGDDTRAVLMRLKDAVRAHGNCSSSEQGNGISEANTALDRAARRFRRIAIEPNDFTTLAKGLTRSYRRGLKWFSQAYAENNDEAFHEWRKCVQAHWRHMSLLSKVWPALFEARVAAARELSQILGDDHDLAILKSRLATLPPGTLSESDTQEIVRMVAARQHVLRRTAKPRGQMLYAEKAKAHGRRVLALWEAATALRREEADLKDERTKDFFEDALPTGAGA